MDLKLPKEPDWETLRRYLGYLDEETKELCSKLLLKLSDVSSPKYIYREFAVERKGDGICICGESFSGKDIKEHLEGCDRCILFSLTMGARTDSLLRTLESSDMSAAVVCDTLASCLTEQLCDSACEQIKKEYDGLFLTERYSPGYGDLPLQLNKSIEKMLDTQRTIGVNVQKSSLLLPRKSVTAIIGISEKETKGHLAGCESCKLKDKCTLRRDGKVCGSK